jgi:hypothetical protein
MSLNLDALEIDLHNVQRVLKTGYSLPLFLLNPHVLERLRIRIPKLRSKLNSVLYGDVTKARMGHLIEAWETELIPSGHVPLDTENIDALIKCIVVYCGGSETSTVDEFSIDGRIFRLKLVHVGSHVVVYFDTHQLIIDTRSDCREALPLRMYIACIFPALWGNSAASLCNIPEDVTQRLLTYLAVEDLGNIACVNKRMASQTGDDAPVWDALLGSGERHMNAKEALKARVSQQAIRRMIRFGNSSSLEDWASQDIDAGRIGRRQFIDIL